MDVYREKMEQAAAVLDELGIDAWLIFVRETSEMADPSFKLISPAGIVWQSAFIFTRGGKRICICGYYDADNFRRMGLYTEVIGYHEGIGDDLRATLAQLDPNTLAINYSINSHAADGLSYGMYLLLRDMLKGTPYGERLVSAEDVVSRVRGRKTPLEVERIRAAIAVTQELFARLTYNLRPGRTEKDIVALMHKRMAERGVGPGWELGDCPLVNVGPGGEGGHAGATDRALERGHIVHLDCGVMKDDYCSDLQRVWYVRRSGERSAPADVQQAFAAVRGAIDEAFHKLRPGAVGWQVDEAARRYLTAAGYPEYRHALGHQLGRTAHDGATILGPRWERYGQTPYGVVEAGNVFTLELGVASSAGLVSLEEDVLVTEQGCEYLSTPQTALWYV